jgi:fumarate reductase subunit C
MPIYWWMHKRAHLRFIGRELTSVFVMFFAVELLLLVRALASGPAAYEAFLDWLRSPLAIVLHIVVLGMVIFHSITWFNLAPKAMVVRVGQRRIPGGVIAGAHIAAWLIVSAVLAAIIFT